MASHLSLAINGWRMYGLRTGIRRYLDNVVRRWNRDIAGDFEVIRLYTGHPLDPDTELPPNIENVVLHSRLPMIPWENLRLAPRARERVLFGPSFSIPLWTHARTVVVIHDAVLRLHPEQFPWKARLFHDRLYEWSARNATLVITDSEASARDITNVYGVLPEKIRVVHLAPDEMFRSSRHAAGDRSMAARETAPRKPYFLFVGKLSGRRDIPTLIEAFGEFLRRYSAPHQLVLAGKNIHGLGLQQMTERAGITGRFLLIENASDQELRELYAGAELFVSSAVYESTSLPVLEAQAMGLPVVCIGSAGMREVTGEAAHFVDRMDVTELCRAMDELWSSPERRSMLSEGGLRNTARLTWERNSVETLDVIREAANL